MPISPKSLGKTEKIEQPKKLLWWPKNFICSQKKNSYAPSLFFPQIIEISLVHIHASIGTGAS